MTTKTQFSQSRRTSSKTDLMRRVESIRKSWTDREGRLRKKIAFAMQNQLISALGKSSRPSM